jgi:hypothetical protein
VFGQHPVGAEFVSPNSNKAWNTKYGPRRVRDEAPTLDEAIAVAQGLSDELDAQTEIAASLMGVSRDTVRKALQKLPPTPKAAAQSVVFTGPASAPRTVVVERKFRRAIPTADRVPSST